MSSSVVSAPGPLRVHPTNPRYLTADGETAILLTGSHTWDNLVDMGRDASSKPFDFDGYLDFLEDHGHNFIRLWAWDSTTWDTQANGNLGKEFVHWAAPQPWRRTGPGLALDGKPKFDLSAFNPDYFIRLRERVAAAGRRGIYVSVMFFEGWGLFHGNRRRGAGDGWAWRTHPFHPENNVNAIPIPMSEDGLTAKVHCLGNPAVNALQDAYIRRVIAAVNDLDNVLYEVINEGGEKEWDWRIVDLVHETERTLPQQHLVGITGHGAERLDSMLASPADWISPGSQDGYRDDPAAWDGAKVSLLDTDHIWGCGGNAPWVWKAFVRGHHPIFMDPYHGEVLGTPGDPQWVPIRKAMGRVLSLAKRLPLAAMTPRDDLASTGFCLAAPGTAYVVYLPQGGEATVDLSAARGELSVEWIPPVEGSAAPGSPVSGGGARMFAAPFDGDAVLVVFPLQP